MTDPQTTNDLNDWCPDPRCGMTKWIHRRRDCDIEHLKKEAERLNAR